MPLDGYTPMFEKMLDHSNITVELNCDILSRLDMSGEQLRFDGEVFSGQVIYTGQADELFAFRFGPLPYRTLRFDFETLAQEDFQGYGTVNYTVDQPYTRITDFKHLTGRQIPGVTVPGPEEKEGCLIPWHRILRIGDDVILVDIGEENYTKREGNSA